MTPWVLALLAASEAAFTALRIAGAAYMVLLGGRLLRNAIVGSSTDTGSDADTSAPLVPTPPVTQASAFRAGLFTNLLNPKVGAFYVALLPQFIPAGAAPVPSGVLLGSVHVVETLLWFALVILGADLARRHLARRGTERVVEAVTGSALVGFGLKLARSGA